MGIKAKLLVAAGILILLGFLFVIGSGKRGAVDLYQLKQEKDRLHRANLELQKKNQERYRTIDRLKNDLEFVEDVARTDFGMIGEDEVVILKKKE